MSTESTQPDRPKKKSKKRRPPRPRGIRGLDLSPPRFDVADLAAIAGAPLWHAVHPAEVKEVTDAAVFVEVRPAGRDPMRCAVERKEWSGEAPATGTELEVRLGAQPSEAEQNATPVATASWVQAEELRAIERVMKALEDNTPVPGVIVAEVKGGYSVALGGNDAEAPGVVRAFLPRSQATLDRDGKGKVVGLTGDFDVVEVESERANIVVGRRKRLLKEKKKQAKETWANLEMDQIVKGTVRAVVPYGAFLDVGGVDGLLHVTDLSWDRQPRVTDIVKVGDTVDVKVIVLDKSKKKLKLGLKQLAPDPWEGAGELAAGNTVEGDVVALTDFGAFVRVSEGVEGLVHLSEMSWDRVRHPSDKFQIGERVKAQILEADKANHRLSLSTKALEQNPYEAIHEQYPEGSLAKGKVKSLVDFGAFVELEEGVDGLIHNGELSWTERINHASEVLTIGDEVEVVVMKVDVGRQRVSCSLKRVKDDPFQKWESTFTKGSKHTVKIERVLDAGVSVVLDEGLSGFVPNRELSSDPGTRAKDLHKQGDEIEVQVIQFDRRSRRVSLSAKAVVEGETRAAYDEYKKREREANDDRLTLGDQLKGQLDNITVKE